MMRIFNNNLVVISYIIVFNITLLLCTNSIATKHIHILDYNIEEENTATAVLRHNNLKRLHIKNIANNNINNIETEIVIPNLDIDNGKTKKTFTTISNRVIQTSLGKVHGGCTGDTCQYLNIPFAEPFSHRFQASQIRVSPYGANGVGSAIKYGPACIQNFQVGNVGEQSEDCMTLNIFAPSNLSQFKHPLPVMVWIYGGGFLTGSAGVDYSGLTFNGTRLAMHGVLVVTIQYRVGIFGFLQQSDGSAGANGFGDMVTALKWIKSHIANFNGDPESVTIFGESAGSVSACTLSHLPIAKGLFHRVIAESGSCYPSGDIILNKTEATLARVRYLHLLGIPEKELLTMNPQELVNLTMHAIVPNASKIPDPFTPFFISGIGQPSVDLDILPNSPWQLPVHDGLDLLHGYNSGEVKMGPPSGKIPNGPLAYFGKYLGHDVALEILEQYGPHYDEIDPSYIIADACLRCNTIRFAQRVAGTTQLKDKKMTQQVRLYVYNNPANASFHGADVPAVFGTTDGSWNSPDGSVNTSNALVHNIQKIWTGFAKGEDISKLLSKQKKIPRWPTIPSIGNDHGFVNACELGESNNEVKMINSRCEKWISGTHRIGGWQTARMCSDFYQ